MPSSVHSSKSTNSENDNIQDILHNDKVRYIRKGYGIINAILLALSFYFVLPILAKPAYSWYISSFSSETTAFFWGLLVVHNGCFIFGNLLMWLIYSLEHPFFERYKTNSHPWPWKVNPEKFREVLIKTLWTLAFNLFVISPALTLLNIMIDGVKVRFDVAEFPSPWEVILQIVFFMLVEDFSFYWSHRLLHHPAIYQHIHKQHHEYYTSISLASEYANPIEFILSNAIPSSLGPIILGSKVHFYTLLSWFILRVLETIDGHCGYEFSWSPYRLLPFSGGSSYHDFHHSHNQGNFGSFFSFWDTLCGTNSYYFRYLSIKQHDEQIAQVKAKLDENYEAKRKVQ